MGKSSWRGIFALTFFIVVKSSKLIKAEKIAKPLITLRVDGGLCVCIRILARPVVWDRLGRTVAHSRNGPRDRATATWVRILNASVHPLPRRSNLCAEIYRQRQ